MNDIHYCEKADCTNKGIECVLPVLDDDGADVYEWYCFQHAHDQGYCPGCGHFWAGTEYFDFRLNGTPYCENCYVELDDDVDDEYDDDWEYPMWQDIVTGEEGGRFIGEGSEYAEGDE